MSFQLAAWDKDATTTPTLAATTFSTLFHKNRQKQLSKSRKRQRAAVKPKPPPKEPPHKKPTELQKKPTQPQKELTISNNKKKLLKKQKLANFLHQNTNKQRPILTPEPSLTKKRKESPSLRTRMLQQLKGARFRHINEQIYTCDSKSAVKLFEEDPNAFNAYHTGYRQQVLRWPVNPLDLIIKSVQKLPKTNIVADFGCGDANLAKSVKQVVHSFDLVAVDEKVTACDMAHVPLDDAQIDVVVFCLSLMGTNLHDYLLEASRVLKVGGLLKIAEVESRFDKVEEFVKAVEKFGFKLMWKDLSNNLFYLMDFRKVSEVKNRNKVPTLSLAPCLYKKR